MTGKACFCGARWNLPAKECSEGHPMTPTEVEVLLLRARCEHLKSEYANLLAQHDAWAAQYHEEHAENEKWKTSLQEIVERRVKAEAEVRRLRAALEKRCCELEAENERLRAVVELVRSRCAAAHPMWAPELREALAALSESEDPK
jgi:chromosome segregation ATPase